MRLFDPSSTLNANAAWYSSDPEVVDWVSVNGTFIAEADSKIQFDLYCPGGEVYVDNFRVEQVSPTIYSPSSVASGAEFVPNSGFDDGLDGYYILQDGSPRAFSVSANGGVGGSAALRFAIAPSGPNGLSIQSFILNNTVRDTVYKLSIDLLSPANIGSADACRMQLAMRSWYQRDDIYEIALETQLSMSANTWTTYSGVVSAMEYATIWIRLSCNTGGPIFFLDNISVRALS